MKHIVKVLINQSFYNKDFYEFLFIQRAMSHIREVLLNRSSDIQHL